MTITVVGMIYRSTAYLDLMVRAMREHMPNVCDSCWVDRLIVANDATDEVRSALHKIELPQFRWLDYRDPRPDDHYLARVYRAWNAGARAAGDGTAHNIIVFVNSDMWFSMGWLRALITRLDRNTIPCSRLVESGKLRSGQHAVVRDFGRTAATFQSTAFERFARQTAEPRVEPGGLYMPVAFYRDDFLAAGGYPEGNIHEGGPGAINTPFIRSGDDHFFHHNELMARKRHVTCFDSVVYHVQEGEMDE